MGLSLELKREFLRCISPNSLKTFRSGFIGGNRKRPASITTAAGQLRPKIRLFWQKSSQWGLLSSPAWGLLSIISFFDRRLHARQKKHRDRHRISGLLERRGGLVLGTGKGGKRQRCALNS